MREPTCQFRAYCRTAEQFLRFQFPPHLKHSENCQSGFKRIGIGNLGFSDRLAVKLHTQNRQVLSLDRVYLQVITYEISNINTVFILKAYNIDINYESRQLHLSNFSSNLPVVYDLKQFLFLFFYQRCFMWIVVNEKCSRNPGRWFWKALRLSNFL